MVASHMVKVRRSIKVASRLWSSPGICVAMMATQVQGCLNKRRLWAEKSRPSASQTGRRAT